MSSPLHICKIPEVHLTILLKLHSRFRQNELEEQTLRPRGQSKSLLQLVDQVVQGVDQVLVAMPLQRRYWVRDSRKLKKLGIASSLCDANDAP
jgi:hypothetical protein